MQQSQRKTPWFNKKNEAGAFSFEAGMGRAAIEQGGRANHQSLEALLPAPADELCTTASSKSLCGATGQSTAILRGW